MKYSTCKLKIVLQIENRKHINALIKNEKSCAGSMSDEDLVRAVRPGLNSCRPIHVSCL